MTDNDTTTGAPGARVDTVEVFANEFAAAWDWKVSPSVLADALRPWVDAIRREARAAALEEAAQIVENLSIRRWADGLTCTQFCAEGIRQAIAAPEGSDGGVAL